MMLASRYREAPVSQVLLYIGNAKMNMPDRLELPGMVFAYRQVDIRTFDPELFLESPVEEELALSVLCGESPWEERLARLTSHWNGLSRQGRRNLIERVVIASRLRGHPVEEAENMAIEWTEQDEIEVQDSLFRIYDRMSHGGLTRYSEFRGKADMLKDQLNIRFGEIPEWVQRRIDSAKPEEIRTFGARFAHGDSLDAIFGES